MHLDEYNTSKTLNRTKPKLLNGSGSYLKIVIFKAHIFRIHI